MEVVPLIIVFCINLFTQSTTKAFTLTNLIDYKDFQENCIVHYLAEHQPNHNLNISSFIEDDLAQKTFDFCDYEITRFQRSFYDTIEENLLRSYRNESQKVRDCAINQLKAYNVSEVFFKAIAYNYYPTKFVTYNDAMKWCMGIIKFNNHVVTDVCGERVLTVILSDDNKSVIELQSCLNDLFRELELNKIVLNDEFDNIPNSVYPRSFGMHTITFVKQLVNMANNLCSSIENIDEMYGSAQLSAIENLFNTTSEAFVQQYAAIDLFGFSVPSKNVEQCIIDEHRLRLVNRTRPKSTEITMDSSKKSLQQQNLKDLIKIVLSCLKFF